MTIAFGPSFTGESGGVALQTAALDIRVKATAAMTMYDMSRNTALGYFDSFDETGRYEARVTYNDQRVEDYKNGSYTMAGGLTEQASVYIKRRRTPLEHLSPAICILFANLLDNAYEGSVRMMISLKLLLP